MRGPYISYFLIVSCAALFWPWTAAGASPERCIDNVCFSKQITDDPVLELKSIGEANWWGFSLYAAALYADAAVLDSGRVLQPVAKRLVFQYQRSISAEHIVAAAERHLHKLDSSTLERHQDKIQQLHAIYVDVIAGDRYELNYTPGIGTALLLNGEEKIRLSGDAFAELYFGIWLSPRPVHAPLRDSLLNWESGS